MADRPLRCAFLVQGEGRGHMTQALAAEEILREAGHEVCGIFVGTSELRGPPRFFTEGTRAPVTSYTTPVLVPDRRDRGMSVPATALHNALRLPVYVWSGVRVAWRLRRLRPDLIVNFFDLVSAIAVAILLPRTPTVAVGHHFLLTHPEFPRPEGRSPGWLGLRLLTWICGLGARARLALSFRELEDPDPRTRVVPPLLRGTVTEAVPEAGEHVLVYLLNPGYAPELKAWHEANRHVPVRVFMDRSAAAPESAHENLSFRPLDGEGFVEALRTCRGLATTAGFEAVCEAMYLDKPVLLVPTEGHVEQACNALDAEAAGAGIVRSRFDLDAFLEYLPRHRKIGDRFRDWVRSAPDRLLSELESAALGRSLSPSQRARKE